MAQIKSLKTLNTDMDGEQRELSFIAGGNANDAATLEDSSALSHEVTRSLTIGPSRHNPGCSPSETKTHVHLETCT